MTNRFLFLALAALTAQAGLITDFSQIPLPYRVVDFQQYAGAGGLTTQGPEIVSNGIGLDVTFTSDNRDALLGSASYGLSVNGSWGFPTAYAAINVDPFGFDTYSMTFMFSSPVQAAAALLNYYVPTQEELDNGLIMTNVVLAGLDSGGNVLESYDITQDAPINTPGAMNAGAYRGILRASSDLYGIRVSNSAAVLTNLTLAPLDTQVPEPSAFGIAGAAIVLLAISRRRS